MIERKQINLDENKNKIYEDKKFENNRDEVVARLYRTSKIPEALYNRPAA